MQSKSEQYRQLGEILRKKREALDLSQSEVLRRLGYKKFTGQLSNMEAGLAATPIEVFQKFGQILDLDFRIVVGGAIGGEVENLALRLLDLKMDESRLGTLRAILDAWQTQDDASRDDGTSERQGASHAKAM